MNIYVGDAQACGHRRIRLWSHGRASETDVFDQFNGVFPHLIGHSVHVFTEAETIGEVAVEVARL